MSEQARAKGLEAALAEAYLRGYGAGKADALAKERERDKRRWQRLKADPEQYARHREYMREYSKAYRAAKRAAKEATKCK